LSAPARWPASSATKARRRRRSGGAALRQGVNSHRTEYQAAIEKSLGKKDYSFTSLESYIGAKVLVEAIRRAGANPTREGLLKTLDSMQNFNVADIWSISARRITMAPGSWS